MVGCPLKARVERSQCCEVVVYNPLQSSSLVSCSLQSEQYDCHCFVVDRCLSRCPPSSSGPSLHIGSSNISALHKLVIDRLLEANNYVIPAVTIFNCNKRSELTIL